MNHLPHMHDYRSERIKHDAERARVECAISVEESRISKVINDGGRHIKWADRLVKGISLKGPASYSIDFSKGKLSVSVSKITNNYPFGYVGAFYLLIYACPSLWLDGSFRWDISSSQCGLLGFELDYWPLRFGGCGAYNNWEECGSFKCPPLGHGNFNIVVALCESRSASLIDYVLFDKEVDFH